MGHVLAPVKIIRILGLVTLIVGPLAWYLTRKDPYLELSWFWIVLASWVVTAFTLGSMALAALFPRSVALDSENVTLNSFGARKTYRLWDLHDVAITRVAEGRYVFEFHSEGRAFKIGISDKVDIVALKAFMERHVPETIRVREIAQQGTAAESANKT
jgi:hypothetical protein